MYTCFVVCFAVFVSVNMGDKGDNTREKTNGPPSEDQGAVAPEKKDDDPNFEMPPPLKDVEIPTDFVEKLKKLPKSQRRSTIFELSALLEEEELFKEV